MVQGTDHRSSSPEKVHIWYFQCSLAAEANTILLSLTRFDLNLNFTEKGTGKEKVRRNKKVSFYLLLTTASSTNSSKPSTRRSGRTATQSRKKIKTLKIAMLLTEIVMRIFMLD